MSAARYHHQQASSVHQPAAYRAPAPASHAVPAAPPGTFAPGTKIVVGNHRVTIDKYLSEGGFAHVYLVHVPKSAEHPHTPETAVLKRVAVPDKDALASMRTEVETMKKLKGHSRIVTYMDSHASQLKGGGYEVFLLMEYCSGGGLIDFMNTRLQHRLEEPEILHIFSDAAEGVATMHYLKPPLLHRDLKVENVLITNTGNSRIYKLCDFGSTAPPRPFAKTAAEARLIEEDVQRHTTLQYRSPEMVDVYRKQPIDEKSDIWALGVLLYKLCYYTTPFEEVGQMAILNASFKFPSYPQFSDRLKKLIASMLRENPQQRPNIYQVVVEVCSMRHRSVPIKDIYSDRTQSEDRRNQQLPSTEPIASPPVVGLQKVAPVQQVQAIPDIAPMRRGRLAAPGKQPAAAKPSRSLLRGTSADPFAALDSQSVQERSAAADELAARFPSLDEFSLLHDRGQKFEFGQTSSPAPESKPDVFNKRVTQALADDAFVFPGASTKESPPIPRPSSSRPSTAVPSSAPIKQSFTPNEGGRSTPVDLQQPTPYRPGMVSVGIQTSPAPSPGPQKPDLSKRPIWRVPEVPTHQRAMSTPRAFEQPMSTSSLKTEHLLPSRPSLDSRSKSHTSMLSIPQSPASSRPSLESHRPSTYDLGSGIDRAKSASVQPRPVSIHVESNLDYLRDREKSTHRRVHSPSLSRGPSSSSINLSDPDVEEKNITSNVDFLRAMEHDDPTYKKHRSSSQSKHKQRSSVSSITSSTKSIIKGRFGDAFRRFENNHSGNRDRDSPLSPIEPLYDNSTGGGKQLTPIAGSVATGDQSDDERAIDETQDLPPEVRRELERRRLSQEERRVANAAAEYRAQLAAQGDQGKGGKQAQASSRASTIQHRVRSLLTETQKAPPSARTAEGYGKYTDVPGGKPLPPRPQEQSARAQMPPPPIAKKPNTVPNSASSSQQGQPAQSPLADLTYAKTRQSMVPTQSSSAPPAAIRTATGPQARPSAPPKPKALRTGGDFVSSSPKMSPVVRERVVGAGAPDSGSDFDEDSFTRRYPSLSGLNLEMVETEILPPPGGKGRVRDL